LFVWDPRAGIAGEHRDSLVQTIDFGPTLLEFFGVNRTSDMQGHSLLQTVKDDTQVRVAGLFGMFGGHVNVTNGRYVYMRASADPTDSPLYEHTLMPSHMNQRFAPTELTEAELAPPFSFTKKLKTIRVPGIPFGSSWSFGTLLFDLKDDPGQENPLRDDQLELRMAQLLVDQMRANDAPESQFLRLGLPAVGDVTENHLQVEKQWDRIGTPSPTINSSQFDVDSPLLRPVGDLERDPGATDVLRRRFGMRVFAVNPHLSLWQLSVMFPQVVALDALRELEEELRTAAQASFRAHPQPIGRNAS
jgi:hypothetical protein